MNKLLINKVVNKAEDSGVDIFYSKKSSFFFFFFFANLHEEIKL